MLLAKIVTKLAPFFHSDATLILVGADRAALIPSSGDPAEDELTDLLARWRASDPLQHVPYGEELSILAH